MLCCCDERSKLQDMDPPLRIVKYNRPPEAEPPRPTRGFIMMGCLKPWRSRCQCNNTDAEITGKNSGIHHVTSETPVVLVVLNHITVVKTCRTYTKLGHRALVDGHNNTALNFEPIGQAISGMPIIDPEKRLASMKIRHFH
jgi:hypothetical protein